MKNIEKQAEIVDRSNDRLLRRLETMEILRIKSMTTWYKLIKSKKLKLVRVSGGIYCVWLSDVYKYLSEQQNEVAA